MNPCKIWIEQCAAARGIEDEFSTQDRFAPPFLPGDGQENGEMQHEPGIAAVDIHRHRPAP
jgi:hypothetical protein